MGITSLKRNRPYGPIPPSPIEAGGVFSGLSTPTTSVVKKSAAIEAAF